MDTLISIVDDDRGVRDALQRMLQSYGFATVAFATAEDFLAAVPAAAATAAPGLSPTSTAGPAERGRTSCLILDMRLPGMSGLALLRRLGAESRPIPTILITASPTDAEHRQAVAAGAFSYLAKPLAEDMLLKTIGDALAGTHAAE